MRLLCDRHVPPRYIDTFCRADWLTVTQVSEHLPIDADDSEIIAHAEAHD
jgi:predicted nuclease of predicted toxin-antitoxin system